MKQFHICIYVLLVSVLFACQPNTAEENERNNEALGIPEQALDPRDKETKTGQEIAENLVHLAERVPDVKGATVYIFGDLAIVGIDVNSDLNRSDVGVIKYEVAEALKKDPFGAYAFISADPDINERLKQMRKEIEDGHPIAGVMNELAGIVGRLIPVVPGPEHRKSEPEPTNKNQKRLNEGQHQELESIQEEQGKRNMSDEQNEQRPEGLNDEQGNIDQRQVEGYRQDGSN